MSAISIYPTIKTVCARTSRHEPQIEITEQYSFFAAVRDGPESARRPRLEVGDRHFTTQNKCREAREETEHKQDGPNRFEQTGKATLRKQIRSEERRVGKEGKGKETGKN